MSSGASALSIYHKGEDGVLWPYDARAAKQILAGLKHGKSQVRLGTQRGQVMVDLDTMKQLRNRAHDEEEHDLVLEIPWNAKWLKGAEALDRNGSLSRKMIEMVVLRFKEKEYIAKILDLKRVPCDNIRENPYLSRGHPPFDDFVSSLVSRRNSDGGEAFYDAILQIAMDGPGTGNLENLESKGLRFVFHGTNFAVMGNILKTGLLPSFRISGGRNSEWFGVQYSVSVEYSQRHSSSGRSQKLLFFLVLQPLPYDAQASYIKSLSNLLQLPLAEITVSA